jgi:anti-sigma B factor antagonist
VPPVPDGPGFSIDVDAPGADGRATVTVRGDVDIATSPRMADVVRERLAQGPVRVDLRRVAFMDSSGVRALNALVEAAAEQGAELRICEELSQPVAQVLELTGMMGVLPLEACDPR